MVTPASFPPRGGYWVGVAKFHIVLRRLDCGTITRTRIRNKLGIILLLLLLLLLLVKPDYLNLFFQARGLVVHIRHIGQNPRRKDDPREICSVYHKYETIGLNPLQVLNRKNNECNARLQQSGKHGGTGKVAKDIEGMPIYIRNEP